MKAGRMPLTSREKRVLDLVMRDMTLTQMGEALRVQPKTISTHLSALRRKYQVKTNYGLAIERLVEQMEEEQLEDEYGEEEDAA